jgi:ABC-type sulfate/molybdate transport systems ATPase subunit
MLSLADRIVHFSEGEVQRIASPEEFYFEPKTEQEGELFGVLNSIEINGQTILFRPVEFESSTKEKEVGLNVMFMGSQFAGSHFINYFQTTKNEHIVLYHSEPMNNEKKIIIKKRN